ncbi:hypothetical protein CWI42_050750 [Ordospora colligata]|uniref:F-box domain-containing protein n=1 Tax=Ordospora colligata OC4 TaxID=1354746 RepID=A0A0B2UF29_9MICR|nr:uncharacterized protein M896_050780 [Ordospora colligata OC4]KHN69671.1 hypothetical protein M896_050780 [Ordospora colligata OC4]TBU15790.1 hypothetical protein CWI41_050770 [Ordospora colligata]TBU15918.1 hypothetical protein CWI40_050790 [Ordospora colligata]TBU18812.1 hypothetical protein CWI42_050750 [Ordospora colligata]
MRRIADVRTHCKRQDVGKDKHVGVILHVPVDVLYMISRYERRLKSFCRNARENKEVSLNAPWKTSYERKAFHDSKMAFDVNLCPFVNLTNLSIRNTCYFDICSINGSVIRVLDMENVLNLDVTRTLCMILEEIKMKRCTISYKSLKCILGIKTLVSVSFDGVVINDQAVSPDRFYSDGVALHSGVFIEMIEQMPRLKRIELINMEVDIERIVNACVMSDIGWFKIRSKDVHVEVGFCAFANRIRCFNGMRYLTGMDLCEPESVYMEGNDVRHLIEKNFPRISFLSLRNAEIDSRLARTLCMRYSKLVGIEFIGCRFEGAVFYEISAHFRSYLRYMNLMRSDLPHDYMCFLGSTLRHCVVRLKNGERVVVRRIGNVDD